VRNPFERELEILKKHILAGVVILLLITSVFQVVAISSFDLISSFSITIAPYWIIGLCIAVFLVFLFFKDKTKLIFWGNPPRNFKWALYLVLIFVIYSIISAFFFPVIFKGIEVLNLRLGMDAQYMNPSLLSWSFSNLGQVIYLFVNFSVFIFLIYAVSSVRELSLFFKVYLLIGAITIAFAIFQHISVYYFPNQFYEFLYAIVHNNHVYSSLPSDTLRANSFFGEASWFSGFAVTFSIMTLALFLYSGRKRLLFLVIIGIYSVLIALSTTGIVTLVLSVLFLSIFVIVQDLRIRSMGRQVIGRLSISILILACVFVFFQQEQNIVNSLQDVLRRKNQPQQELSEITVQPKTVAGDIFTISISEEPVSPTPKPDVGEGSIKKLESGDTPADGEDPVNLMEQLKLYTIGKFSSTSFRNRLWADQFSIISVFPSTYFLGAGWGSNRPSSFVAFLLSNVGIIGFLSFFGFVFFLTKIFIKDFSTLDPMTISISAGFYTYLLALIIALPDLNWPPTFWLLSGLMISGLLINKKRIGTKQ